MAIIVLIIHGVGSRSLLVFRNDEQESCQGLLCIVIIQDQKKEAQIIGIKKRLFSKTGSTYNFVIS